MLGGSQNIVETRRADLRLRRPQLHSKSHCGGEGRAHDHATPGIEFHLKSPLAGGLLSAPSKRFDGAAPLVTPRPDHEYVMHWPLRSALLERLHILHCLLGLRPIAIVGIDIDCADDTAGIDDKPTRHRQCPAVLAV